MARKAAHSDGGFPSLATVALRRFFVFVYKSMKRFAVDIHSQTSRKEWLGAAVWERFLLTLSFGQLPSRCKSMDPRHVLVPCVLLHQNTEFGRLTQATGSATDATNKGRWRHATPGRTRFRWEHLLVQFAGDRWAAQCMAPEWPSRQQAFVDSAYARFGVRPQDSRDRGARSGRQASAEDAGEEKEGDGQPQKEFQARPDLQRPPPPRPREGEWSPMFFFACATGCVRLDLCTDSELLACGGKGLDKFRSEAIRRQVVDLHSLLLVSGRWGFGNPPKDAACSDTC